jgi:hypothetical protein
MRFRLLLPIAAGAMLLAASVALAAKPKTGSTYSSPSTRSPSVFFKAASAKKLLKFSASEAIKCGPKVGGFGGIESQTAKSVKVSKGGTFKVSGGIYGAALGGKHGKKLGTQTVTGKFVSSTTVRGKVTTNLDEQDKGKSDACWGVTKSYTATSSPAVG